MLSVAALLLAAVASATVSVLSAACSSSDSGTSGTSGTSGGTDAASGTEAASAADSGADSPAVDTIPAGSVQLAQGPCVEDKDCAASARGTVACFVGGMGTGGGGGGDGGSTSGPASYCTLKCSPPGAANTTVCAAPFLEFCNMRGYCKLH